MRLGKSKSKNSTSLYVIKSTYINKKHSTKIVEKLGTKEQICKKHNVTDAIKWAKEYIENLNKKEKQGKEEILVRYKNYEQIDKNNQSSFNGGYLFLQKIYHELGIDKICNEITKKYKFEFDLNSILSRLIYSRILFPASKHATNTLAKNFIEQPNFELQHIYRALEIISKENDLIQSTVFKNSLEKYDRNTGVIYYDCTNYFFEIEQADVDGYRQYGKSKEHRPNPIVGMGLFMDSNGIPLAFNINKGNTNEQITLQPLEKKIISDFNLSKFVVCTDAGLASNNNRKFNSIQNRAFITTQSIKKLSKEFKDNVFSNDNWKVIDSDKVYNLSDVIKFKESLIDTKQINELKNKIFYKEIPMNKSGISQNLIVTYSFKYKEYQEKIRNSQIERANKLIEKNTDKFKTSNQNDFKRFIKQTAITDDGEIIDKKKLYLDTDVILNEAKYDGYYGVCTNLEDSAKDVIKINSKRWEIEECFRIMKSEFKARPVYLSRDDRITAHFTTCFLSLVLYRFLEKKLDNKFTVDEIISNLRNMNFLEIEGDGYIPTYTRNDFTDYLHDKFDFRTDLKIVTNKNMKKILKDTKKQ